MNKQTPSLSIVFDDLAIHYDALSHSRLEQLISKPLSVAQVGRAETVINLWREARISKYNYAREFAGALPDRYVLVTDLTLDNASGRPDQSNTVNLNSMLVAALNENSQCTVVIYVSDKAQNGHKTVCGDQKIIKENPRILLLEKDVHPVRLIEQSEAVYTLSFHIGFEALLWGKKVHTFGSSFFSDWGLTEAKNNLSTIEKPLTVLVNAVLIEYYQYIDPETGENCELERLIEWLGLQRKMRERFPHYVYALGFSFHKKSVVQDFFQGSEVRFCTSSAKIPEHATVVSWSRKYEPDDAQINACNIIRLEDGFIRSVGLGADLIRPLSYVMDKRGIYFDATQPSDLENLLLNTEFDESLIKRAQKLRKQLVAHSLTKYNVGSCSWQVPESRLLLNLEEGFQKIKLILVPGQVESDASLTYGAPGIKRNIDLLRAVQTSNPEAYIIYKPHPDVVAGLRNNGLNEENAEKWCDEVVIDVPMGELLLQVDEIHTMTSLTGFEALLRAKKVICYGQPFYSGWGLTDDINPVARRGVDLTLDKLVAGVLILYPAYISRSTGKFTTAERALEELLIWRNQENSSFSIWRKVLRWYLQWTKSS